MAVFPLAGLPWSLLFLLAPRDCQFQAVLAEYPCFLSRLAALQEPLWNAMHEHAVAPSVLVGAFQRAGFRIEEIPDVLTVPRQLLPKAFAKKPVFRFSRFRVIPLLLPDAAVAAMTDYLQRQVDQFADRSFFLAPTPVEPLQWRSVIEDSVDLNDPLYPLLIAFGLPLKFSTPERLHEAREILTRVLAGDGNKCRFESVYRARPIFARSDLVTGGRSGGSLCELEEECNLLRARMVRALMWPELYAEVVRFLSSDAHRWRSGAQYACTIEFLKELDAYRVEAEKRWPVLNEAP